MIALVIFTSRREIMGRFTNPRTTTIAAVIGKVIVLLLNAILLLQIFGVPIPGLAA